MPKKTFFNLPEEKRKKIYKAALDEFSQFSYDNASINRIVKNSGISKGSIYQYFEDKKDIFKYLINNIYEEKMKYVTPVMMNPEDANIFTLIREMYLAGIKFANENPKLTQIGIRFMSDKEHSIYKEMISEGAAYSNDIFEGLLTNAIKRGEVRTEIDTHFVSYIITSLNRILGEYFFEKNNSGNFEEMMEIVDKLLDLLKNGLSK